MKTNKHVAKLIDRQNINKVKHLYRHIMNINTELANIHRKIEFQIDKNKYRHATEYVNQYISFTSIWNLKFVYNIENPEVALLQLFHLEYILNSEPKNKFLQERKVFAQQFKEFVNLNLYSNEHINYRKKKMFDYIKESESQNEN